MRNVSFLLTCIFEDYQESWIRECERFIIGICRRCGSGFLVGFWDFEKTKSGNEPPVKLVLYSYAKKIFLCMSLGICCSSQTIRSSESLRVLGQPVSYSTPEFHN